MTSNFTAYHLVKGIVNSDTATKQKLGQLFAQHLGLEAGRGCSDDGIDGFRFYQDRKIHFQSKLSKELLDKDEARKYYSDIKYHQVEVSLMLAGVGYKETFRERLYGHDDISSVRIHLLTLRDLFEETKAFQEAVKDLPPLQDLSQITKLDRL